MNIKLLAVALAFVSTSSIANNVTNVVNINNGTNFFGVTHFDSADFTDVFNFTVVGLGSGPFSVDVSLTTVGNGFKNIDFVSADLNGTPLFLSPAGYLENGGTLSSLDLANPLVLTVTGHSGAAGTSFATYAGTINVSPIPEPETYAMLLAGLGLIGFSARRRKND